MSALLEQVQLDAEGYLADANDWTEGIAKLIAEEEGIMVLTPRHLEILNIVRDEFIETGKAPTLRRLTKVYGIPTKELYGLFPGGPGKKAARIAGVKKPKGCI